MIFILKVHKNLKAFQEVSSDEVFRLLQSSLHLLIAGGQLIGVAFFERLGGYIKSNCRVKCVYETNHLAAEEYSGVKSSESALQVPFRHLHSEVAAKQGPTGR